MGQLNVIHNIDCIEGMKMYEDNFFHCCVTSPPYWGLRDYDVAGQIGLEGSPEEYIGKLITVFHEVKRVLRDDGTLWVVIGDCYAHNGAAYGNEKSTLTGRKHGDEMGKAKRFVKEGNGLKPKDLIGIPWMFAFALRADGWYLRDCIIWHKPNAMPESVQDRTTKAHEYIFLLSKCNKYCYDAAAIRDPAKRNYAGINEATRSRKDKQRGHSRRHAGFNERWDQMTTAEQMSMGANKRSVWTVATSRFPEAHFATYPEQIPTTCIMAGCPVEGLVLDPFMGAGTTALAARRLNRNFVGFELNPDYVRMADERLKKELGMFYP